MVKILAIDTSTEACSAALIMGDEGSFETKNIYSCFEIAPREHTKLILGMIDDVLKQAGIKIEDIDAFAFGRGPGAFTGLRIAAGVIQGLALSQDKPVIPVSTLAALAYQVVADGEFTDNQIIPAIDARMGETYWGVYRFNQGSIQLVGDEMLSKPVEIGLKVSGLVKLIGENRVLAIGSGWDVYSEEIFKHEPPDNLVHIKMMLPSAEAIAQLALPLFYDGKTVSAENAQPVYIRNKVAEKRHTPTF